MRQGYCSQFGLTWRALLLVGIAGVPVCAIAQESGSEKPRGTAESVGGEAGTAWGDIVVTAQKRDQRLQDVPVPVTALSAESLTQSGQVSIQSYFSSVPGLNMQFLYNRPAVAIRGLTTGATSGNPIVAYIIDDAPFGSSSTLGTAGVAPDLDPSELQRVEVLRGPQGTLYGASSIGGLVKYVTVDPSLERMNASASVGGSTIQGSDELGYNARGALNMPVSDTFAVRVSASTRTTPGYIDNVVTEENDVNKIRVSGVNLAALWRPSEDFSLRLSALHQSGRGFGSPDADASLGLRAQRQTNTFGAGRTNWQNNWISATAKAKLGASELTSVTSYSYTPSYTALDLSYFFGEALAEFFPGDFAAVGALGPVDVSNHRITQEVRLDTPIGEKIDLLVGGFFSHEREEFVSQINAHDPTNGNPLGNALTIEGFHRATDYAAFTDLTVNFTDQFNVQVGGRVSQNIRTYHGTNSGPFAGGTFVDPKVETRDRSVTYLLTMQYKPTPDTMLYGRLASGFRPGGINGSCSVSMVPCSYGPDNTVNFEIGAKGSVLNRIISYDLSVYYIDWKRIQLGLLANNGFPFSGNAGRARSKGVELSLEARPVAGLSFSGWVAWNDAKLREGFPAEAAAFGLPGDRLPYSSRFSGKFSVDGELPLTASLNGFAGASVNYVGRRFGEFVGNPADAAFRQKYPGYAQADLHLGVEYDNWRLMAYMNNVTNRRGLVGGGFYNPTTLNPNWMNYIQPRTIGLSIDWKFN